MSDVRYCDKQYCRVLLRRQTAIKLFGNICEGIFNLSELVGHKFVNLIALQWRVCVVIPDIVKRSFAQKPIK